MLTKIATIVEYVDYRYKLVDDLGEVHWLTGYEFSMNVDRTLGGRVLMNYVRNSAGGLWRVTQNIR